MNQLSPRLLALLALFVGSLILPAAAEAAVNGKVVYATDYTGNLYTVNPDGTNNTRITPMAAFEEEPEYSPDGGRIVYTRHPAGKGDDLFVMSADGSGVTRLTSARQTVTSPTWTADGSRILFLTERDDADGAEIYSIAPDGTGETLLAADALSLSSRSTLSTGAGRIAYVSSTGEDVVVMNLDGSGKTELAPEPLTSERDPQLSPDGTRVAFESDRGPQEITRVYTIGVDGTGLSELSPEGASLGGWSPDGGRIAITEGLGSVAVLNADGTGRTVITPAGRTGDEADEFSPDGSRVASSQILPKAGEDPFYRLFSNSSTQQRSKPLTAKGDGALYGDWQPLAAPSAGAEELTVTARAVNRKATRKPRVLVECSNECDVKVVSSGRLDGAKYSSRRRAHIYGADPAYLEALGAKTLERLRGAGGSVELRVKAVDDFGSRARVSTEVKLKR